MTRCGLLSATKRALDGTVITVGETVGLALSGPAKYWSEWQDLNLRPPRPEQVSFSAAEVD